MEIKEDEESFEFCNKPTAEIDHVRAHLRIFWVPKIILIKSKRLPSPIMKCFMTLFISIVSCEGEVENREHDTGR